MTNKASEDDLSKVHGRLAEWCMSIMQGVPLLDKDGNAVLKPDGQPWLQPPSAAYLNVIRQLLKDNKIEAPASPGLHQAADGLDDLPVFDDDNVVPMRGR